VGTNQAPQSCVPVSISEPGLVCSTEIESRNYTTHHINPHGTCLEISIFVVGGRSLLYIKAFSPHPLPSAFIYHHLHFKGHFYLHHFDDFLLFVQNISSRCCSPLNSQHITRTSPSMTTLLRHHRLPLVSLLQWPRLDPRFLPSQPTTNHYLHCPQQDQRSRCLLHIEACRHRQR
jgi:hypothetical protein